jgi:hypothetical protein
MDDVYWHRRMYSQSRFRWVTENATSIALRYTRGRLEFSAPGHLPALDHYRMDLETYVWAVRMVMAPPLRESRAVYAGSWSQALETIDMTEPEARAITWAAVGVTTSDAVTRDVARVLRGFPLPNPLTEVWELKQLLGMYEAALGLLEDAVCDLVVELQPTHPLAHLAHLAHLAPLTLSRTAEQLQLRVDDQRRERGAPGDPRRIPVQRY